MKTAVIAVGKEVLTGKTVNTNLKHIALGLKQIGIDVTRSFVIDDVKEEYFKILDFIDEELIIFTGGLGPTIDDISRESVYEYFDVETHLDLDVLTFIKTYFDKMDIEMKETNNKQAMLPVNSVILNNDLGTAPGVYFSVNGKRVVLFPGPPHEMLPMLNQLIDILKKDLEIKLVSKGFKLVGTGESTMEEALKGFYELHPNVNIAPYANVGEIKYIFTSNNEVDLDKATTEFYNKFSEYIFGDLEDTLESVIVEKLHKLNQTISFAESCTGGMLASRIVNVSGSSNVFKESFVTYANEAKIERLNVSKETLDNFGAVSDECAYEMVEGLRKETLSDVAVSITGIAGPTGGTTEKPVGLVHFGVYCNGSIKTHKRVFNGNRIMIRTRATIYALNLVRKELLHV